MWQKGVKTRPNLRDVIYEWSLPYPHPTKTRQQATSVGVRKTLVKAVTDSQPRTLKGWENSSMGLTRFIEFFISPKKHLWKMKFLNNDVAKKLNTGNYQHKTGHSEIQGGAEAHGSYYCYKTNPNK